MTFDDAANLQSCLIKSNNVEETISAGVRVAKLLQASDVIVLSGDLGAGKTHFSKGIASGLNIQDDITSPTFNILRLYDGQSYDGQAVQLAHWDLYRLNDEDELEDVDFFGIVESGCISLIEWGDKFIDIMPDDRLEISITIQDNLSRKLEFSGFGFRGHKLVEEISKVVSC